MVRLFVGGLPPDITQEALQQRFIPFGKVEACELVPAKGDAASAPQDPSSCRGFAYIDLEPKDSVSLGRCLSLYNHSKWRGHTLRVEIARQHYLDKLKAEWAEPERFIIPNRKRKRSAAAAAASDETEEPEEEHWDGIPLPLDEDRPVCLLLSYKRRKPQILEVPLKGPPNPRGIKRQFPPARPLPLHQLNWQYDEPPSYRHIYRMNDLWCRASRSTSDNEDNTQRPQHDGTHHPAAHDINNTTGAPSHHIPPPTNLYPTQHTSSAAADDDDAGDDEEQPVAAASKVKPGGAQPGIQAAGKPASGSKVDGSKKVVSAEQHSYLKVLKTIRNANDKEEAAAAAAAAVARAAAASKAAAAAVSRKGPQLAPMMPVHQGGGTGGGTVSFADAFDDEEEEAGVVGAGEAELDRFASDDDSDAEVRDARVQQQVAGGSKGAGKSGAVQKQQGAGGKKGREPSVDEDGDPRDEGGEGREEQKEGEDVMQDVDGDGDDDDQVADSEDESFNASDFDIADLGIDIEDLSQGGEEEGEGGDDDDDDEEEEEEEGGVDEGPGTSRRVDDMIGGVERQRQAKQVGRRDSKAGGGDDVLSRFDDDSSSEAFQDVVDDDGGDEQMVVVGVQGGKRSKQQVVAQVRQPQQKQQLQGKTGAGSKHQPQGKTGAGSKQQPQGKTGAGSKQQPQSGQQPVVKGVAAAGPGAGSKSTPAGGGGMKGVTALIGGRAVVPMQHDTARPSAKLDNAQAAAGVTKPIRAVAQAAGGSRAGQAKQKQQEERDVVVVAGSRSHTGGDPLDRFGSDSDESYHDVDSDDEGVREQQAGRAKAGGSAAGQAGKQGDIKVPAAPRVNRPEGVAVPQPGRKASSGATPAPSKHKASSGNTPAPSKHTTPGATPSQQQQPARTAKAKAAKPQQTAPAPVTVPEPAGFTSPPAVPAAAQQAQPPAKAATAQAFTFSFFSPGQQPPTDTTPTPAAVPQAVTLTPPPHTSAKTPAGRSERQAGQTSQDPPRTAPPATAAALGMPGVLQFASSFMRTQTLDEVRSQWQADKDKLVAELGGKPRPGSARKAAGRGAGRGGRR